MTTTKEKPVEKKKSTIRKKAVAKKTVSKKAETTVKDKSFNPQAFEPKWQKKWEKDQLYRSVIDESRPKHYALTMLPYPSGDLHIGHWYAMIPPDARARFKRMQGYNVLFPMGFDAFGLPAENAAIRDGVHPMKRTFENIERMRKQMRSMGAMFDWNVKSSLLILNITNGPNGSSFSYTNTDWRIAKGRPWTGAQRTTQRWRVNRSKVKTASVIDAARL